MLTEDPILIFRPDSVARARTGQPWLSHYSLSRVGVDSIVQS